MLNEQYQVTGRYAIHTETGVTYTEDRVIAFSLASLSGSTLFYETVNADGVILKQASVQDELEGYQRNLAAVEADLGREDFAYVAYGRSVGQWVYRVYVRHEGSPTGVTAASGVLVTPESRALLERYNVTAQIARWHR